MRTGAAADPGCMRYTSRPVVERSSLAMKYNWVESLENVGSTACGAPAGIVTGVATVGRMVSMRYSEGTTVESARVSTAASHRPFGLST